MREIGSLQNENFLSIKKRKKIKIKPCNVENMSLKTRICQGNVSRYCKRQKSYPSGVFGSNDVKRRELFYQEGMKEKINGKERVIKGKKKIGVLGVTVERNR